MFNQINRLLLLTDVSDVFCNSCAILTMTKRRYEQLKSQLQSKTKYIRRLYSLIRINIDVFYVCVCFFITLTL